MDSDTILVRSPSEFPDNGYAACRMWRTKQEEIVDLSRATWAPSGPFLLGRNVFSKHRFCEDFIGYGYEDADYHENILANAGIAQRATDAKVVHVWHPRRGTQTCPSNYEQFIARKSKTITLVAYNRPEYTRKAIDALRLARGIENYKLYCGIDPGCLEVRDACEVIDFMEREIVVNPTHLGVNYNNKNLLQLAFGRGSGFNLERKRGQFSRARVFSRMEK